MHKYDIDYIFSILHRGKYNFLIGYNHMTVNKDLFPKIEPFFVIDSTSIVQIDSYTSDFPTLISFKGEINIKGLWYNYLDGRNFNV